MREPYARRRMALDLRARSSEAGVLRKDTSDSRLVLRFWSFLVSGQTKIAKGRVAHHLPMDSSKSLLRSALTALILS